MKALLKGEIKKLEQAKETAIIAFKALKSVFDEINKKVNDYSCNRSDRWYESDASIEHNEWEHHLDLKDDRLQEIQADIENLSFKEIYERKSEYAGALPEELFVKLHQNRNQIEILFKEQTKILKELEKASK